QYHHEGRMLGRNSLPHDFCCFLDHLLRLLQLASHEQQHGQLISEMMEHHIIRLHALLHACKGVLVMSAALALPPSRSRRKASWSSSIMILACCKPNLAIVGFFASSKKCATS